MNRIKEEIGEIFENTILPEWALLIGVLIVTTITGKVDWLIGGSLLIVVSSIIFFIYKKYRWVRTIAVILSMTGLVFVVVGLVR